MENTETITIKEYRRIKDLKNYHKFDVVEFLKCKKFVITKINKDKINETPCVKVSLRIIEDEYKHDDVQSNEGKVFTLRIDNDDVDLFEMTLEELMNSVGCIARIPESYILDSYIFNNSSLTVIADDIDVLEDRVKITGIDKGDRLLKSLNKFKQFEFKEFVKDNPITLKGISKRGNKDLRIFAHTDKGLFEFRLYVDDVEKLPYTFFFIDGSFEDIVSHYEISYITTLNNNTSLLIGLKSITFKSDVIEDSEYTLISN